ncbi:hypothetical protein B0H14DRAFT_2556848 [Mycena olivaceomarginata]|nr:hypothetical protein B0H14DRAFT_2556848 [Mycena olivaceomarginata]
MVSARYTPTLSEEIRGRYILAPREGSIELWNVNGMMPIWTRSSDLQAVPAFEVAGSGRSKAVQSFFPPLVSHQFASMTIFCTMSSRQIGGQMKEANSQFPVI